MRIKKIQDELRQIEQDCQVLMAAKEVIPHLAN
jgi:hypothetical protein